MRMGPPPRSLAAEAHGCFMVRTPRGSNRIQGRGAMSRAQGGLPSVVLPSLVGNGKDPCMMTRLIGRHPYCDTQVTVWQRAGEGSPAVVRSKANGCLTGPYQCWPSATAFGG